MGLAEEMLNSIYSIPQNDIIEDEKAEEHIFIDESRQIVVPASVQMIGVQNDKDVETRIFDCPRYWDDGIDLWGMAFYINYRLPNGKQGTYVPYDLTLDENNDAVIHFSWLIEDYFTTHSGNISFLIMAKSTDDNSNVLKKWNSRLNRQIYVGEGLEERDVILSPEQEDIITQALQRIDSAVDRAEQAADRAEQGSSAFTLIATHIMPSGETGFSVDDERINNHIIMIVTQMYNSTSGVCFVYNMATSYPNNESTRFTVMGDSGIFSTNAYYYVSDGWATLNGVETTEGDWICRVYDTGIEIPLIEW